MRIAFFSDNFYPELSGIADSILRTGTELARRGHHVAYYAPRYTAQDYKKVNIQVAELSIPGVEVERFASISYPTGTGQGRLVIPTGFRTFKIKKFNPDVLHVHLPFGVGMEGVLASKFLRKPLIGTNHTPMSGFLSYSPIRGPWAEKAVLKYTSWFYNRCQFVSSPSSPVLKEMEAYGFKRPSRVISNPLEGDVFRSLGNKLEMKRKYKLPGITLLYAGRLAPEKSIDLLIEAAAQLQKKIPTLTVALIGSGSWEKNLREQAKRLGIEDRVKFFGFVREQHEMNEIYNASDIFVMPSTTETQSMTMIQGMLAELPIIAANSWGLPEYVSEKNGFLFKPGDVWSLVERIASLAADPELARKLGRGGRLLAEGFSTPRIADEWERVYGEAVRTYNRK